MLWQSVIKLHGWIRYHWTFVSFKSHRDQSGNWFSKKTLTWLPYCLLMYFSLYKMASKVFVVASILWDMRPVWEVMTGQLDWAPPKNVDQSKSCSALARSRCHVSAGGPQWRHTGSPREWPLWAPQSASIMSKHQSVCLYLPPYYYCISPLHYYLAAFAG